LHHLVPGGYRHHRGGCRDQGNAGGVTISLDAVRQTNSLLAAIPDSEVDFFESTSREIRPAAGEILFHQGAEADSFYIVSQGKVGLELISPGKTPMVVQTLGPGELVGLSWFFPPHRWNWNARVFVDSTLIVFDAEAVRQRCEQNSDLASAVLEVVAGEVASRLQSARIQLLDLYRGT
jgi:CRP-like cAMP-binding protein